MKNLKSESLIYLLIRSHKLLDFSKHYRIKIFALGYIFIFFSTSIHSQQILPWRMIFWSDVFDTFDSTKYFLGRNTSYNPIDKNIILIPELPGQAGRLFLKEKTSTKFFDATFRMHLGYRSSNNIGGADGIVFAFAPQYDYPTSDGGSINFDSCRGYGVEFDTYLNPERNDPSEEHIAIIRDETRNHLDFAVLPTGILKNNQWHDVHITMLNGYLEVILDGTSYIRYDIPNFITADSYFGFISASGGSFNRHLIEDVSINVPSRSPLYFGTVNKCLTTFIDTTIVIINNTQRQLNVTTAQIVDLVGNGNFQLTSFSPMLLNVNDSIAITIRFTPSFTGLYQSVLEISASNGEIIIDTLRAFVDNPNIQISASAVIFPKTHVGLFSDQVVTIQNIKSIPFTVDSITISGNAQFDFRVLQPKTPFTLLPDSSLQIVIRFSPSRDSNRTAAMQIYNRCTMVSPIQLNGNGEIRTLQLKIDTNYVLRPFQKINVPFNLIDAPIGTAILSYVFFLRFDENILQFLGIDNSNTLSERMQTSYSFIQPGVVRIESQGNDTLQQPGTLIMLRFQSLKKDTGCSWIWVNNFSFNPKSIFPNTPRSIVSPGRICVNPSCRLPDGLIRIPVTANKLYQNNPNPFNSITSIRFFLSDQESSLSEKHHVVLKIYDHLCRMVKIIFDREYLSGEHYITVNLNDLTSGIYNYVLITDNDIIYKTMLLIK